MSALGASDLIVCSLERWDEVWRRNQFLVAGLLRRNTFLRVLFVEPPHDPLVAPRGQRFARSQMRRIGDTGRLWALRPLKPLPRRLGVWADRSLRRQAIRASRSLGFRRPILWVNDLTYAPLARTWGIPSVYDVTDDWLLEPAPDRELARRRHLESTIMEHADQVVVCSPALAASRGAARPVHLIPNGVDTNHFATPQPRPHDLPPAPVAVYAGTLHDERIDSALLCEAAQTLPHAKLALIGPDCLSPATHQRLRACPNVTILGPRPYRSLPAYLQHANALFVPHRITPFTETLDPIKAYECLAVGTPTIATEIAGFRNLERNIITTPRLAFVERLRQALARPTLPNPTTVPEAIHWDSRCREFEHVLRDALNGGVGSASAPGESPTRSSVSSSATGSAIC